MCGNICIEDEDISLCNIVGGLYNSYNWEAEVFINCKKPCRLIIKQPVKCSEVETIEAHNFNFEEGGDESNNNFRMDHLNLEEKKCLLQLLQQYKSIFYNEHTPLTFTNAKNIGIHTFINKK